MKFKLKSKFKPTGDQPTAIEKLTKGFLKTIVSPSSPSENDFASQSLGYSTENPDFELLYFW